MMANDLKVRGAIVLDGEKDFKDAVTGINKSLSVLKSEMEEKQCRFS